ncbi:flagellar protein FlgN [Bacillaceae bacterium Marseille-Q3522]|nr:flagellar protein FlgN [Bacillaceae bacterium Marseille-Q3522]
MTAEVLITSLEKLLALHKSLLEVAVQKTTVIKNGDIGSLQQLLKDEQMHVAAIQKVEMMRQETVHTFVKNKQTPTVHDCLKYVSKEEEKKITLVTAQLTDVITALKEQNELNQQLIHHSLQFVNMSLQLIRPQPNAMNYSPPTKKQRPPKETPGLFNSQA